MLSVGNVMLSVVEASVRIQPYRSFDYAQHDREKIASSYLLAMTGYKAAKAAS